MMFQVLSKQISMKEALKYFVYIVACSLVFVAIAQNWNGRTVKLNTATTFEWEKQVSVYFPNSEMGSNEDCSLVFPVSRVVPNAETLGPGALNELLSGPTESEKMQGYFTGINHGVLMQKFEIVDGVAYVDLSSEFSREMGGSCRVASIRSQIDTTLASLPDINTVVLSVDGETENILEP